MLIEILPSTSQKMRVLDTIYFNKEINIRNIIRSAKASPNLVVRYVNKLAEYNIVNVKEKSGIKEVSFNFKSKLSELFYPIIEINRKETMLEKYPLLKPFSKQFEDITSFIVLVYGSFSRLAADKESDLDVWIITDKKEARKQIEEILVSLPIEYSVTIETKKDFLKNTNDAIHQNIMKERVILSNVKEFINLVTDKIK